MNIDFENKHVNITQEYHSLEPLGGKDATMVLEAGCEILEELNIKHWLSDGTLLALTRDGDFLPHDSDIDVDVFFQTKEEASKSISRLISELYDCRHGGGPKFDVVRTMSMQGYIMQVVFTERTENIVFDIHVYYPKQWEDEQEDKMYTYSEHGALWYPLEMFESLGQIEFDGYDYPIPDAESYCELRYGADWKIPKTEKEDWESEASNIIHRPKPESMLVQKLPYPNVHKSTTNSVFSKYKNIHSEKTGFLFATGPTLLDFKIPNDFEDAIKIGLNRVYNNQEISDVLDYYFFGSEYEIDKEHAENVQELIKNSSKEMISFASVFRHGELITDGNVGLKEAVRLGALPFESNHFAISKDISKNACIGFSIAFPALQFMLYSGIKKIYLVGCDLVDTSKHFDGDYSRLQSQREFTNEAKIWLQIWKAMSVFVKEHYPDVEILNVNPIGLKGVFGDAKL